MFPPCIPILVAGLGGYENTAKNIFPLFVSCFPNHVPKREFPSCFTSRGRSAKPGMGRGELYLFNIADIDVTD